MKIFGLLSLVALVWSSPAIAGKKKKKKNEPAAPVVGWHQAEGDMGACYHPPNFEEMGVGSRRMAWMTTRDELMSQWQGNRGDGVLFDDVSVINLETALLAKPERIEQVAKDNLAYCKDAMSGKGTSEWSTWIVGLNGKLTEGECAWPNFAVTMYNYLSINNEWQNPAKICKGDAIKISISSIDYYRLAPKGPWINGAGSSDAPSGNVPCKEPACTQGMVVFRFRGESGAETVGPVGLQTTFVAPEHGTIDVMINDDTLSDNVYKVERGLEHHASIDYSPGNK